MPTWVLWGEKAPRCQRALTSNSSNSKRWKKKKNCIAPHIFSETVKSSITQSSFDHSIFFDCLTLISLHINILVDTYFELNLIKEICQAGLLALKIKQRNITQLNVTVIYPCVDFVSNWRGPVCVCPMGICDRWAKEWDSARTQRADVCKAEVEDALGPSLDEVPRAGAPGKSLTYREV